MGVGGNWNAARGSDAGEEADGGALISVDQSVMGWDVRGWLGMMDTSQVL